MIGTVIKGYQYNETIVGSYYPNTIEVKWETQTISLTRY